MNTENNDKSNNKNEDDNQWKNKVQDLFQACQSELKRTTQIGMKMLSASQSNSDLHESYEKLGHMLKDAIKDGDLKWENEEVMACITQIDTLEEELKNIEDDVHKIKEE